MSIRSIARFVVDIVSNRVVEVDQGHVLVKTMQKARIKHGGTIRADIPDVRISSDKTIHFCEVRHINPIKDIKPDDGSQIPSTIQVQVNGLKFPGRGNYDLRNVLIHTNGRVTVEVDKASEIVKVS